MRRIIHLSATQRIVVNVLDFLPHHVLRLDRLRVTSFLPQLMRLINFVPRFIESQLVQKRFVSFFLHPFDDRGRREGFELADALG